MGYEQIITWLLLMGGVFSYDFDFLDDAKLHPKYSTSCDCGWSNKARIVGGSETGKNEYPFMAVLLRAKDNHQFCGGTVLTRRHVLTAAHCTAGKKPEDILVALGAHDLSDPNEQSRIVMKVDKILDHEKYNLRGVEASDITLLLLKDEIPFSKTIGPVCLPNIQVHLDNQMVKVLGWGLTEGGTNKYSPALREADLRVLTREQCSSFWQKELIQDTVSQICTHTKGKDSCQVDSGGPLIWHDPDLNKFIIVGLVSYGGECAGMKPAVNTDVTFYLPWIKTKVSETYPDLQCCVKVLA